MSDESVTPIIVPSTYAGACEPTHVKQDYLLTLSKNARCVPGPSLFVLKYGVLPCTLSEGLIIDSVDSSSDDDASSVSGDPYRSNRQRKQPSIYHITRLVKSF